MKHILGLALALWMTHSTCACVSAQVAVPDAAIAEVASRVAISQPKAKKYFMTSLKEAYDRVLKAERPIQVDLYIMVHFLVFQDELKLEEDPGKAAEWRHKLVDYFLDTFKKQIWNPEGCLAIKVLMGLRMAKVPYARILPVSTWYANFIKKQWPDGGVGECFTGRVTRTYHEEVAPKPEDLVCTPDSDELESKAAYYQALVEEPDDPMSKVMLPSLARREAAEPKVSLSWIALLPSKWVVRTYRLDQQKVISKKLFETSAKGLAGSLEMERGNDKPNGPYLGTLLYAYFLAGGKITQRSIDFLNRLLSMQGPEGQFPGNKIDVNLKHNTDATSTYEALLAMSQFLKATK
jgi:hypothetical protein